MNIKVTDLLSFHLVTEKISSRWVNCKGAVGDKNSFSLWLQPNHHTFSVHHLHNDQKPTPGLPWWRSGASLVVQWLRVCLPMQGTRVRALVWEDPTCRGATRPVSHSYWACASGACAPQQERPRQWGPRTAMSGPRSPQLEEALAQKRRPNTAKINK